LGLGFSEILVGFAEGFEFILFNEGNLLVVADDEVEFMVDEVDCADDAEEFELKNQLLLDAFPNTDG
jgi:hypothetical protein